MNRPRRWDFVETTSKWEMDFAETPHGNYILLEDYVALERKTADLQRRINELSAMIHPVSLKAYMNINNIDNNFNPNEPHA